MRKNKRGREAREKSTTERVLGENREGYKRMRKKNIKRRGRTADKKIKQGKQREKEK